MELNKMDANRGNREDQIRALEFPALRRFSIRDCADGRHTAKHGRASRA